MREKVCLQETMQGLLELLDLTAQPCPESEGLPSLSTCPGKWAPHTARCSFGGGVLSMDVQAGTADSLWDPTSADA